MADPGERTWTLRVCANCDRPMDGNTGCLGTMSHRHPPSGACRVTVVEESRLRQAEAENARLDDENEHLGTAVGMAEVRAERLEVKLQEARAVCEAVDAHYSASLDYRPAYVAMARRVLEVTRTGVTNE